MRKAGSKLMWITACMAAVLLAGCAGQTKIESDLKIEDAPDWVNEGTQAVSDRDGRLIHGVGSSPELGDPSLQISTADNRARAEIARVVSTYMNAVVEDFMASSKQAEGYTADASIQQQISSVSKVVLNGAKIMGRWKDDNTNIVYSFAELDMKKVQDIVKANQTMNEGLKVYLLDHGNAAFDELAKGE
jgi:hypothetical protein